MSDSHHKSRSPDVTHITATTGRAGRRRYALLDETTSINPVSQMKDGGVRHFRIVWGWLLANSPLAQLDS
jgi:hypothetical protein